MNNSIDTIIAIFKTKFVQPEHYAETSSHIDYVYGSSGTIDTSTTQAPVVTLTMSMVPVAQLIQVVRRAPVVTLTMSMAPVAQWIQVVRRAPVVRLTMSMAPVAQWIQVVRRHQ